MEKNYNKHEELGNEKNVRINEKRLQKLHNTLQFSKQSKFYLNSLLSLD